MFGKKKVKTRKIETLAGRNTIIKGDVHFTGGLHLDGKVIGNVEAEDGSDSMLLLSSDGCVEGEVRVPDMLLNGKIIGDVYSSGHVELASDCRICGNLYYNLMEMAVGAEVNGRLVHCGDDVAEQASENAREQENNVELEESAVIPS